MNPDLLTDEEFARWWAWAPTVREIERAQGASQRALDATRTRLLLQEWREGHPQATCADSVALRLAEMEVTYGCRCRREP